MSLRHMTPSLLLREPLSAPAVNSSSLWCVSGPLNRAEWVKMLSTFFNLETVANSYFNTISTDYNSDKAAAAQATQGATLKRVAWVSQVLGYGTTPAMYVVSMAAYKKAHVEDAGECTRVSVCMFVCMYVCSSRTTPVALDQGHVI